MSEGLHYMTGVTEPSNPLFVEWEMVINQWDTKSARLVGEILQSIEMLGLPQKQEDAIKATVKRVIYEQANSALDWMAQTLWKPIGDTKEQRDAAMIRIKSDINGIPTQVTE